MHRRASFLSGVALLLPLLLGAVFAAEGDSGGTAAPATISGHCYVDANLSGSYDDGEGEAGVSVTIGTFDPVVTNDSGAYGVTVEDRGTYSIAVNGGSFESVEASVTVQDGEAKTLDFTPDGPVVGAVGDVSFVLSWTYSASGEGPDLDLFIDDPKDQRLSCSRDGYSLGPTPEGGVIDQDDQGATGPGDGGGPERAYWPTGAAPDGTYTFGVNWYTGNGSADYRLEIFQGSTSVAVYEGEISSADQMDYTEVGTINTATGQLAGLAETISDEPATLSVTSPADGTTYASPGTVTITGTASHPNEIYYVVIRSGERHESNYRFVVAENTARKADPVDIWEGLDIDALEESLVGDTGETAETMDAPESPQPPEPEDMEAGDPAYSTWSASFPLTEAGRHDLTVDVYGKGGAWTGLAEFTLYANSSSSGGDTDSGGSGDTGDAGGMGGGTDSGAGQSAHALYVGPGPDAKTTYSAGDMLPLYLTIPASGVPLSISERYDIYIAVRTPGNTTFYTLQPDMGWSAAGSVVAYKTAWQYGVIDQLLSSYKLVDGIAAGSYTFMVILVPTGTDVASSVNWTAHAMTTVVIQ